MQQTRRFLDENFLLSNDTAVQLYRQYAEPQPVIDYHCHLPPDAIAEDRPFRDLTHLWLAGDHYKWRAMRTNGVDEHYVTGDATPWEKFLKYAETVPATLRNPLYHWTHMELAKPFGINGRLLDGTTAREIWDTCNEKLREPAFSPRGLLRQFRVEVVCTTDDPADDLRHHRALLAEKEDPGFVMLPAFRPDKVLATQDPATWNEYINRLSAASGRDIRTFDEAMAALEDRAGFFALHGCVLSDHGIEEPYADVYTATEVSGAFATLRGGGAIEEAAGRRLRSAFLHELGRLYARLGWTQQFHLGAIRNNNTRLFRRLGPDTGFDSIGDFPYAKALARLLDRLDCTNELPRTILYNLNPADNEMIATMIGNFQDGSVPGKMQFGSGWWFNDQRDGMIRQIEALSNMGLLYRFVGMLTDSRSFVSYSRHEYFRRLLCDIMGRDIEAGLLPGDLALSGDLVERVCYRNAKDYFGFTRPAEVPA